MKPNITDRSTWTSGWIVEDPDNHILICVDECGNVVGTCDAMMPPVMVKRWIVKVGEFKKINIRNQMHYIQKWNERMVNDDDEKYRFE
ncbi:hypothetical protein [Geobacillus phage TP-84]|uniref:Uncharacterized protein n=1 Tax=Geobacillus phage TP-84 TaxID=1965361 RepID=A0A1U9WQQ4_9CAUD|nr:hypothetical protein MUK65_gp73 [Geobacillus phage TP-84]AQY55090.1 hypothetical protein [Geobacillus phage TP-84]